MTKMALNGSQGGIRMWPSEATAAWLYDTANIALIIALVTGAIATALIVWMGNVKEEYLKKDLAQTTERAANANERAAQLENDAAQAKLELERLKKNIAWRRLTKEQYGQLVAQFKSKSRKVVMWNFADPECTNFSDEIEKAFKDANWEVERTMGFTVPSHDIKITTSDDSQLVIQAFAKIGINVVLGQDKTVAPHLTIGLKPRPF